MIVTDPEQLSSLLDMVHDYWFDVERISFDWASKTVAIHLEKESKHLSTGSDNAIHLLIRNVVSMSVDDTEKIRDYDLNEIQFDSAYNRLVITGGIPLRIEVNVTSLLIEVHTEYGRSMQ